MAEHQDVDDSRRSHTYSRRSNSSPSLNDDLLKVETSSRSTYTGASGIARSVSQRRKGGSPSSIVSSSFRPSFDDSAIALGLNTLSTASVSPLGKNSVFELIHGGEQFKKLNRISSTPGASYSSGLRGPTVKDIPPIQLSKIKKVHKEEFESYLVDIDSQYDKYQNSRNLTESTLQEFIEKCEEEEEVQKKDGNNITDIDDSRDISVISESERSEHGNLNKLSSIPNIFFLSDFRLDDPRIFKTVTENSNILVNASIDNKRDLGSKTTLINNSMLQEKLSWYLDTVEIHLIHEISKSSDSFFDAIDDLKEIKKNSKNCIQLLNNLDLKFQELDINQATKGLDILIKIEKRDNVQKLEQSMVQISTILSDADIVESSYYNGNYKKCLDELDAVESLIRGDVSNPSVKLLQDRLPYPLVDVSGLPALTNLIELLKNLRIDCGKAYSNLFTNLLLDDLRNYYENVSTQVTLDRMSFNTSKNRKTTKQINLSYQSISDEFKSTLKEYISGLSRCHDLATAFSIYEEKLLSEVKNIIRVYLPGNKSADASETASTTSTNNSNNRNSNPTLSTNLRSMTPKEFETMLVKIYTALSESLRRLTSQQKILLDLALTSVQDKIQDNPELIMSLDITQSINQCIDIVQNRMSKIINVRKEQTASCTLNYFLRFYSINALFLTECELISGYNVTTALNDLLLNNTRYFCSMFHSSNMRNFSQVIDKENWKDTVIPGETQETTDDIMQSGETKPEGWLQVMKFNSESKLTKQNSRELETDLDSPDLKSSKGENEEEKKYLTVDGNKFSVPRLAVQLVTHVKEYLILNIVFPQMSATFEKNVTDLLKLLNSRSTQAVLGAGATKTAGMKHITTKHLAICSQLLDFVLALIPYIEKPFEKNHRVTSNNNPNSFANNTQSVMQQNNETDFTRVKSFFKEHQNEIFAKLVSIMNDRAVTHSASIRTINWSEPIKHPDQCHKYMEILVKETITISNVLQKYLPDLQYSLILSQIFDNYKRQLLLEFTRLEFKDLIEKSSSMKDIDYFRDKLGKLPGYGNSGQVVWENINSIPTLEDQAMELKMRTSVEIDNQ